MIVVGWEEEGETDPQGTPHAHIPYSQSSNHNNNKTMAGSSIIINTMIRL